MAGPETRYTKSGDLHIAYQVTGNGPVDLVLVPGYVSNLDVQWEDAGYGRLLRRLGAFARVIQFDKRGTGLSDRVELNSLPSVERRADDIRSVMDAAGSGRAVLIGVSEGAAMAILFAAAHPARARALVLYGGYAQFHSAVIGKDAFDPFVQTLEEQWGGGASLRRLAPDRVKDPRFAAWWARFERLSASPAAAAALARMNAQIDVKDALDRAKAPTLVLHRREDAWVKIAAGRQLAQRIRGARFLELPGRDHLIWTGEIDRLADEIEEFVTGIRPAPSNTRILVTMLVARLVAPEQRARRLGDGSWRELLDRLAQASTQAVTRFGGEIVVTSPTELCARFDGPARAIRCALALRDAARDLELKLAAGVHTGEVEIHGGAPTGYALHVTERIAATARAGEVLVSAVVTSLVAGAGFRFVEQAAEQTNRDGPSERLFGVMVEQHLEPAARLPNAPGLEALSTREREVLGFVANGLSNAAIADRLDLSEHTVKRHVANILVKLDLPTRAAAAALAAREHGG